MKVERLRTPKLAEYRRLSTEHVAWDLLRATTAPLIFAFFEEAFRDDAEVELTRARSVLESLIYSYQALLNSSDTNDAATYIRTWLNAGYMREADGKLTMTDPAVQAKRFADGLGRRENTATATHLRLVQDAIQNIVLRLTGNRDLKIQMVQARIRELEREMVMLKANLIDKPGRDQVLELMESGRALAKQLTGSFRLVEDEMRRIDGELRRKMIQLADSPGAVLSSLLDETDVLAASQAGASFIGFAQLLCDEVRSEEFRRNLQMIGSGQLSSDMPLDDRPFFATLMRSLTAGCNQVIHRQHRTNESLRAFIESGAARDNRAVEAVLTELFKVGVEIHDAPLHKELDIWIHGGSVGAQTVDEIRLADPGLGGDLGDIVEHVTGTTMPDEMFDRFKRLPVQEIAGKMQACVRANGKLTIAGITALAPIEHGLEELIARVRIAQAVKALDLHAREPIEFVDLDGRRMKATVPSLEINPESFPSSLSELQL